MTTTSSSSLAQLQEAYRTIKQEIGEAAARSGRTAEDVLLVAVTKYAGPDQIRALVEMGHVDLGESKVQQLSQRVGQLDEFLGRKKSMGNASSKPADGTPEQVRWHMIGHLQRNKVKQVVPLVQLIHSVDSLRLAEELHSYAARRDETVDILLQVNASGEAQKYGVPLPAVLHLAEQIDSMLHLRLRGLMTMAPLSDNPEDSRIHFARTADVYNELRKDQVGGDAITVLSMGMSRDYKVAIEEGANLVRIGRGLFGETES